MKNVKALSFNALLATIMLFSCMILLESVSWGVLRIGLLGPLDEPTQLLIRQFPVQLRMEPELRRTILAGTLESRKSVGRDVFDFDPALAFRHTGYLQWYTSSEQSPVFNAQAPEQWWDGFAKAAEGKYVVLTFGGSTTSSAQPGNWPRHVADLLHARQAQDAIVLNAGHNGFTAMQEHLFATYWVLPELENRRIKPNIVFALNGVNDTTYGVSGLNIHRQTPNSYWYHSYPGYYQYLDSYFRDIKRLPLAWNNFQNALADSAAGQAFGEKMARWLPMTLTALSHRNVEFPSIQSLARHIISYKGYNIFRIGSYYFGVPQSAGPLDPVGEGPYIDDGKSASSLGQLVSLIQQEALGEARFSGLDLEDLDKTDHRDWASLPTVELSEDQKEIMDRTFINSTQALHSTFSAKGIPVMSFLQPISNAGYNGAAGQDSWKDIPSLDYVLVHWAMAGQNLGAWQRIPGEELYAKHRRSFRETQKDFPGHLVDISELFAQGRQDFFTADNIHYTQHGSVLIADAIIETCLTEGYCGTAQQAKTAPSVIQSLATRDLNSIQSPILVKSYQGHNLVKYKQKVYVVPQSMGAINWDDPTLEQEEEVFITNSINEGMALLIESLRKVKES